MEEEKEVGDREEIRREQDRKKTKLIVPDIQLYKRAYITETSPTAITNSFQHTLKITKTGLAVRWGV